MKSKDSFSNYSFMEACNTAGVSMAQLSHDTGIPQPTLYAYQSLRLFPKPENALKIATYLGRPVDYLFPDRLRGITTEIREERRTASWKKYRGSLITPAFNGDIDARVRIRQLNSLNNPKSLEDISEDLISDENVLEDADKSLVADTLMEVMKTLTFREREVLKMRFGIGYDREHNYEEVGKVFGAPRERVRQIEAKAVRKLQHPDRAFRLERAYFPKAS